MAILEFEPQEADIVALEINTLVPTQDPGSIRWTVAQGFFAKSKLYADEGTENASQILRLLGGALSMRSTPFAPRPFGPMMQTNEGRSLSIEDIGANDVPAANLPRNCPAIHGLNRDLGMLHFRAASKALRLTICLVGKSLSIT